MIFRRRRTDPPTPRPVQPLTDALAVRIVRQIGDYKALYLTNDEFATFCKHINHDARIYCCDGVSIQISDVTVHVLPDTFSEISLKVDTRTTDT